MELSEFSNEFDVYYNSITSNQAPGLDEYEKSVFLTKAQDETLKSYFDPRSNRVQEGFDGSPRRQIDFSSLICTYKVVGDAGGDTDTSDLFQWASLDPRSNSRSFSLPFDIFIILNEQARVSRDGRNDVPLTVVPVSYEEYNRLMSKPFARPLKRQAWRIFSDKNYNCDLVIGPTDTLSEYVIRYLVRPNPIILVDLSDTDLSIGGSKKPMNCQLDPILHHEILQRAVELAKAAYMGDLQSQIALGQASQTDIGQIQSR